MNDVDRNTSEICFSLLVAGAIIGLTRFVLGVEFGDAFEMVAIAKNLVANGTFANPFYLEKTGPTAVEPPLYPLWLAALLKISGRADSLPTAIGDIFANSLTAAWLPRVSLLFYGDPVPGIAGAVLWLAAARLMPSWDANYTVAGLIFFCLFSARSINDKRNRYGFGALAGGLAGLLFLLNPSSVLVWMPWLAYLLVSRKARLKQAATYCCIALAICLLTVSPWLVRNYHVLGAPVPRTNLGFTLYASNNSCAQPGLIEDERCGCYQSNHPNGSVAEARLLRKLGETEYDRRRIADTKNWIITNPGRFAKLTLRRFWAFWFPSVEQYPLTTAVVALGTALSVPGLILMARRREPVTLFVMGVLLFYPPMYYVVVADVRYRYPVLWLSLLAAGYPLRTVLQWLRQGPFAFWLGNRTQR